MKPVPTRQRRQAHRQRKAYGRALHQVRMMRGRLVRGAHGSYHIHVPRILRKHAKTLRYHWHMLGS